MSDVVMNAHELSDRQPDSWRSIFNRPNFHALNARDGVEPFLAEVCDERGLLLGGISGMRDGETFVGGFSAPFGGLDVVKDSDTAQNIAHVVQESVAQLKTAGFRRARLKMPPACYGEAESMVQFAVLNNGFAVERTELNQHIPTGLWSSDEEFAGALRPAAAKSLRRSQREDFVFAEVVDDERFVAAHALLSENRQRKGRKFALSLDYLQAARVALHPDVQMFELLHDGALIAAALMYRVRPAQSLVVAWGDAVNELPRSPMVMLAYRIVSHCIDEGITALDLGISNEPETQPDGGLLPNYGLVQFKRTMLARIEPRFTLAKSFE